DLGPPRHRSRPAHARPDPRRALSCPLAATDAADRARDPRHERVAALLPRRASRTRWTDLHDAQVPDAAPRCRGSSRAVSRARARRADAGRDDAHWSMAASDAARRGPAAPERPPRRHEPGRAASDPAAVLRGARARL